MDLPQLPGLEQTYLTFSLDQSFYAIETSFVEEIFFLPQLAPIPQLSRAIVGVLNLREDILPIMDLNLRFGYQPPPYQLTDSIIVLQGKGVRLGIIVNGVHDVRNIPPSQITPPSTFLSESKFVGESKIQSPPSLSCQKGIARSDNEIIIVLDPHLLLDPIAELLPLEDKTDNLAQKQVFYPHATPEERHILQERAEHLQQGSEITEAIGFKPLAVVGLGTEFFAIDLKVVREFTPLGKITPVPCCPSHIIGNMNLRGEILTLVDISHLLNIPPLEVKSETKAMVIETEGLVAGILVNDVYDVFLLDPSAVTSIPTALHSIDEQYLQGATMYFQKMMSILDLTKILTAGGLVVNEMV